MAWQICNPILQYSEELIFLTIQKAAFVILADLHDRELVPPGIKRAFQTPFAPEDEAEDKNESKQGQQRPNNRVDDRCNHGCTTPLASPSLASGHARIRSAELWFAVCADPQASDLCNGEAFSSPCVR